MVGTIRPRIHYCHQRHSLVITGAMGAVRVNRCVAEDRVGPHRSSDHQSLRLRGLLLVNLGKRDLLYLFFYYKRAFVIMSFNSP